MKQKEVGSQKHPTFSGFELDSLFGCEGRLAFGSEQKR